MIRTPKIILVFFEHFRFFCTFTCEACEVLGYQREIPFSNEPFSVVEATRERIHVESLSKDEGGIPCCGEICF